jgi:hypothetical protein
MMICPYSPLYVAAISYLCCSHPDKRHVLLERKLKPKCLGDKPRMPVLQTMGTYVRGGLRDIESGGLFEHLARKYLVESDGRNRASVCKVNAEVSAFPLWGCL